MKRYFQFNDEPISGTTYLLRLFLSAFLTIIFIGLWLGAATGYKRAGAFGWSNDLKIMCAIAVPIHIILNILANELEFESPTFAIFALLISILHLILLFKNGNKVV
tara:strand:- start:529 stop:846 length:318 start_codon:yes stop_codon:yes gene_type:complete